MAIGIGILSSILQVDFNIVYISDRQPDTERVSVICRVYSPIAFGKKTDKNGDYIRKYVPKLAKYPAQYIYEPWEAPKSVQKAAGCIIGEDYPYPIVQHGEIHKKNIQRMKAAYDANKAGGGGGASSKTQKRPSEASSASTKRGGSNIKRFFKPNWG